MIDVQASARPPLRPQKSAARSTASAASAATSEASWVSANSEAGLGSAFSTVASVPRRKARISGIPLQYSSNSSYREESNYRTERRYSKVGNTTSGSITIQVQPSTDSLNVMVDPEANHHLQGESTYTSFPAYADEDPTRKASLVTITPLQIRRKQVPVQPLEAASAGTSQRHSFGSSAPTSASYSSPPTSPPALTHSVYGGSMTDRDSVQSSLQRTSWPASLATSVVDGDQHSILKKPSLEQSPLRQPETVPRESEEDQAAIVACPIEQEPDRPGYLRSPSLASSGSEDDDDDDDDSVAAFSLEDFPVPSSVIASPASKTVKKQASRASALSGVTVNSTTSVRSGIRPDLFDVASIRENNAEWDLSTELEIRDRVFRAEMKAMSRADKQRRKELRKHFDIWKQPSHKDMYEASLLSVKDEYGNSIRFGSLFEGQRTIVCFIRHFWCSMCQSYVDAIAKVKPAVLEKYGLRLIIVSNGSWKMIKGYKKLLGDRCPYPIYTDRGKHIYTAMGMTLRTYSAGKSSEKGAYLQRSFGALVLQGMVSGLSMPLKPPGDQQQLGGEFVLGPGLKVTFCHRMKSTRSHAEIEDVLASVGVDLNAELAILQPTPKVTTPRFGAFSSLGSSTRETSAANTSSTIHAARFDGNSPALGTSTSTAAAVSSSQSTPNVELAAASTSRSPSPTPSRRSKLVKRSSGEKRRSAESEKSAKDARRRSVPHIETPPPISPMSTGFLKSDRSSAALPSPLGLGLREPLSADLETSSSRFSSSSEESQKKGVGALAKSIRMHLKVVGGSHNASVDNLSINSRGSLRATSPARG